MGERFDVAVIGAGITGLATAFFLRERGIETVVLERTGIGAGATGVQPGGVRAQWGTRVNCLLALESQRFYREFDADARLEPTGYLFLAHGEELLAELTADVALQNELGIPSRILGPAEVAELVPGLDVASVAGAAWNGDDGYFDRPQAVVEAFARGARIEIADVRRLERDGTAWRVGPVHADAVVVAAGYESRALAAPLGVDVPIEPQERHLFLSEPIRERLLEPLVVSTERAIAAKQLANGRVLSATEQRRELAELLPILSYVTFPVVASGFYDLTPDRQPLVGELDAGLWLAAGFSGHGFMLAPAIARRLAAALAGEPVDELLDAFAPARFARGKLEPERRLI